MQKIPPTKQETPPTNPLPTGAVPSVPASSMQAKKGRGEKADKNKGGRSADVAAPVDVSRLDMRVGRIQKAWKHPDADGLYVEEGEGQGSAPTFLQQPFCKRPAS